jgi:hypothetical protein
MQDPNQRRTRGGIPWIVPGSIVRVQLTETLSGHLEGARAVFVRRVGEAWVATDIALTLWILEGGQPIGQGRQVMAAYMADAKRFEALDPCCPGEPPLCCSACLDTPKTWTVTIDGTDYVLKKGKQPNDTGVCFWSLRVNETIGCYEASEIFLTVVSGHGFYVSVTYPGHSGESHAVGDNLSQLWRKNTSVPGAQDCSVPHTLTVDAGPGIGAACPSLGNITITPSEMAPCQPCCGYCDGPTPQKWAVTLPTGTRYIVPRAEEFEDDSCRWSLPIVEVVCGVAAYRLEVQFEATMAPLPLWHVRLYDADENVHTTWRFAPSTIAADCTVSRTLNALSGHCTQAITIEPLFMTYCPEEGSGGGGPVNCGNGCCTQDDTPDEIDVDLGVGGWTNWLACILTGVAPACDGCETVRGWFTVTRGFGVLFGNCMWTYEADWCMLVNRFPQANPDPSCPNPGWPAGTKARDPGGQGTLKIVVRIDHGKLITDDPGCRWRADVLLYQSTNDFPTSYEVDAWRHTVYLSEKLIPGAACLLDQPLSLTKYGDSGSGMCRGALPDTLTIQAV